MKIKKLLKKISSITEKPAFWLILLVLITSVVFFPALKMEFWWVDDGYTIMMARKIIDSVIHFNFDGLDIVFNESGGRFRILYWFFQTLVYLFAGLNPTLYFFVHYLVILLSVFLIFKIVFGLTKSNLSAFVASILYVLSPINTENLYRLGPQEPIMCLFLTTSVYFLVERKMFLSIFFLLLTTLIKENGFILWIPIFFLYITRWGFFKKRDLLLEKYCFWGVIFSVPFILNTFLRHGGYSGYYTFNVNQIIANFGSYILSIKSGFSPFLTIFLATYIFRVVIYLRNQKYKKLRQGLLTQAMFIVLFLVFLAVQLPWEFVLDRYLMPATVGLVIFMGLEIAGIKEMLLMRKVSKVSWFAGAFVTFLFIFICVNMVHVYNYGGGFAHQTRFIQSLYKDLAKTVPPNGIVLLNFLKGDSTMELVAQTGIQLGLFYNRPDIRVEYLSLDNLPKENFIIVGTPQIREEYTRDTVEKSIGNYRKDDGAIQEGRFLVLTTATELFKQSIKKIYKLVNEKRPLTSDGIFTYYVPRDRWYKYYVPQ
jgi:hypothetical protein